MTLKALSHHSSFLLESEYFTKSCKDGVCPTKDTD